jgi:dTDP-3,4-didehydro-2,6-dideoxy-alpha-D-glucose 3-reductase
MRLVVWGLGRHAIDKILPAVSAAEGLHLYGVCSRNATTVSDCAQKWNCHGWTSPHAMLSDSDVDVVYVATPIGLHAENSSAVLRAGKHLWCEKPFTSRLDATLGLLESSRAIGVSVCEGHMYLHHPQFSRLREFVSDGRIGRVLSLWSRFGIPKLEHPGFRLDPTLGGGALFDVGCYPVSAIRALFPDDVVSIRDASVSARDDGPVDTDGYCLMELSNGVQATLEWRTNASYRNEIEIWGEDGSVFTDKIFSKPANYRPSFRLRNRQGLETVEYTEAADHFVRMLEAFKKISGDSRMMEVERTAISRRALLMDRIGAASVSRSPARV